MLPSTPAPKSTTKSRSVPSASSDRKVRIGRGTRLENNVTLMGNVTIGCYNHIYPNAVIGGEPQDISYTRQRHEVIIGDHNIIRECVTINRASEKEDGITRIGDHNFLMACCHVAHDCQLGNHIISPTARSWPATFMFTITPGSPARWRYTSSSPSAATALSPASARFGTTCRRTCWSRAIPARPRCINAVGLKRNNFSPQVIQALAEAHRLLYRSKVGLENAWEILRANGHFVPQVNHLLSFVQGQHEGLHGRGRERRRAA